MELRSYRSASTHSRPIIRLARSMVSGSSRCVFCWVPPGQLKLPLLRRARQIGAPDDHLDGGHPTGGAAVQSRLCPRPPRPRPRRRRQHRHVEPAVRRSGISV